MGKIEKPNKRTYWVARDDDGNVIHYGKTEPNQVTVTGQKNLITFTNELDQKKEIERFVGGPPVFNYDFDYVNKKWMKDNIKSIYIPISKSIAYEMSSGLYQVVEGTGTGLYAEVIDHPDGQSYSVLKFAESDVIPVDINARVDILSGALQFAVDNGSITQQELDNILVAVPAYSGQEVNLVDFVPPSWADKIMSFQDVVVSGYFTNNNQPNNQGNP